MIFILLTLTLIECLNLTLVSNHEDPIYQLITEEDLYYYNSYDQYGDITSVKIEKQNEQDPEICNIYPQEIYPRLIGTWPLMYNGGRNFTLDERTYEDLYNHIDERYSCMVEVNGSIVAMTTQGVLQAFNSSLSMISYKDIHDLGLSGKFQQLVVGRDKIYYFEQNLVIGFILSNGEFTAITQIQGWERKFDNFKVAIHEDMAYVSLGKDGIVIYSLGSPLVKVKTLNSMDIYGTSRPINIVDLHIRDDELFLLDQLWGISSHTVSNTQFNTNRVRGVIPILDAKSFSIFNETLIAIVQNHIQSQAIELYLPKNDDSEYHVLRITKARSQFIKAYLNNEFAIIQTQEYQFITFINQFTDASYSQYTYLDFGSSIDFLISGDKIWQLTYKLLNLWEYDTYESYLFCDCRVPTGKYSISINFNSTKCSKINKPATPMTQCQNQQTIVLDIERSLFDPQGQDVFVNFIISFGAIFAVLLLLFIYLCRRYQKRVELIDEEVEKRKKRTNKLPSPQVQVPKEQNA